MAELACRFGQILSDWDLGRLVLVRWPVTTADPSDLSLLLRTQSVDILDLSVRPTNCLHNAGIKTIGELAEWSTEQLLHIKNMGRKSVREIHAKLDDLRRRNPDDPRTPARTESFCLSVLLNYEECGINEDVKQKLNDAGIARMDDLVTRNMESLQYWAGLSDAELLVLQRQLGNVDLSLESLLPLWVRAHHEELREAFKVDVEQLLSTDMTVDAALPLPLVNAPGPTCLEEELETFFAANADDRNKQIVRRLMGWDGGPGTTLEQTGQEFDLSRERIRQIPARALRRLTDLRSIFLERAIECVERCVPASAESAETALVEAGIVRTRLRVEGIAATAKHLQIPVPWSIEECDGRRLVVNPVAVSRIQEFLTMARKRVSHYRITSKHYVVLELSYEITVETLDVYCSLLNLVWLDDVHDWFWLPTTKNSVLNRLAKILRVAPKVAVSEARAGIFLRDGRMEGVELPEGVFRSLCASLPRCRIEGDELTATGDLPAEEEDTNEMLLYQILNRSGPVMQRRDLWTIANASGIEKVNFDRLLSDSNIIVNPAREL